MVTKDGLYTIERYMFYIIATEKYSNKKFKSMILEDKNGQYFEIKSYKETKRYYLKENGND